MICPKEKEKGEEAAADFSDSCSKYCQHVNVRGGGTIRKTRKLGAPTRFVERLGLRDDFVKRKEPNNVTVKTLYFNNLP